MEEGSDALFPGYVPVLCEFIGEFLFEPGFFRPGDRGVLHDALPRAGGDEGSVLHCYFFCYGGL